MPAGAKSKCQDVNPLEIQIHKKNRNHLYLVWSCKKLMYLRFVTNGPCLTDDTSLF
jgi:hypothetical protein